MRRQETRATALLFATLFTSAACTGPGAFRATAATSAHEALEGRIVEIAEIVKPSVVHIESIVRFNDRRKQVSGSGFIASADHSFGHPGDDF